ncbi:MAG: DUF3108 domain-containing protein [Pseudomonadota bacterium]|nr:DUF3108 domain-containing protein [Pseudomonadota bacterium]
MNARYCVAGLLFMGSAGAAASATAAVGAATAIGVAAIAEPAIAEPGVASFSAHYQADWKSISVGTSDLELKQDAEPGHYIYTWTITAHGIFRMVYRDDLIQKSWFSIRDQHVRPLRYGAVDGAAAANLSFDWDSGRVRGKTDKKQVDLPLKEGIQDVMSIQVEVMLDLKNGDLPKTFAVIDRDEVKEFIYTQEGSAKLSTALGELDTVMVASRRAGGDRILKMWFAPALGFVPVQAERTRDGKLEFAMRIKSLKR